MTEETTSKPDPTLCYWNQGGIRCDKPWTVSPSVTGKGPKFCQEHLERYLGKKPDSQDIDLPIDTRLNQELPRQEGESLHAWSMRCRNHLLEKMRIRPTQETQSRQEPGEDREET